MPKVETSIEVARPREEIVAYLTDRKNANAWSTELVDVTYDGELAEGTTGADIRKVGRKQLMMQWTVTAFDPPNRVVFESSAPFPATADFSFRPAAAGTLLTCSMDLRPRGFWRLLGPLIAREGRKSDQAQFQKVKQILEAAHGGGPARSPETDVASA